MGSIISAHCDCGYSIDELGLGGGMMDFTTNCSFPFYCEYCSILFEGNVLAKKVTCPKCFTDHVYSYDSKKACGLGGKNIVFDWDVKRQIGRKLVLTDGKYLCPSCRTYNLKFIEVGFWD